MTWLILLYVPALWLLWRIMQWDSKGRTTLSFAVLLFWACTIMSIMPIWFCIQAFKDVKIFAPACTCEMVKNHECIQK